MPNKKTTYRSRFRRKYAYKPKKRVMTCLCYYCTGDPDKYHKKYDLEIPKHRVLEDVRPMLPYRG